MIDQAVFHHVEDKMKKALEHMHKDLGTIRTGRATPALLERIVVEYYGQETPLKQVASIAVPEPRVLQIQAWDKAAVPDIEKAISKSDLGLTPNTDGNIIRLNLPALTEERRKELVKVVHKKAEESRVALRGIRRDALEEFKALEKKGTASEDEGRRAHDSIQKMTDKFIKEVDVILAGKEKEILEV